MRDAEKPFADFEDDFRSVRFPQMAKPRAQKSDKRGMVGQNTDKARILRDTGVHEFAGILTALRRCDVETKSIQHVLDLSLHLLIVFDDFFNAANHVKTLFRNMIKFTRGHTLEAFNCIFEADIFAFQPGEGFGHGKRL